ncbi:MAG: AmmeMemoRadiSam system protein A [Ignavibacteria bacterium]|nr:AmmeMemoRadiSam system protein A [Ignavibacteria bacterium]
MALSPQERGVLLLCARESIMTLFSDIPVPMVNYRHYPNLLNPGGAFVTLKKDGELRGCIGYIESDEPLFETVCEAAKLAAVEDHRFPPVDEMELPRILIEISVLSQPEYIGKFEEIEIGRHGLILEDDLGSGVLLPQVAIEYNMSANQFISALCQKAGLPSNEWMKRPLRIKAFTAEVFGEQVHRNLTGEIR